MKCKENSAHKMKPENSIPRKFHNKRQIGKKRECVRVIGLKDHKTRQLHSLRRCVCVWLSDIFSSFKVHFIARHWKTSSVPAQFRLLYDYTRLKRRIEKSKMRIEEEENILRKKPTKNIGIKLNKVLICIYAKEMVSGVGDKIEIQWIYIQSSRTKMSR